MKTLLVMVFLLSALRMAAQGAGESSLAGNDYRMFKVNAAATAFESYYFQPNNWAENQFFVHRGDTQKGNIYKAGAGFIFDHTNRQVNLDVATVALTGDYQDLVNTPATASGSIQSRSFNSAFQASTTRAVMALYTVSISATLNISGGQTGTVFLEISPNNSTWAEVGRLSNSNTGTLTLGLGITQALSGQLAAFVPTGYWIRLRTASTGTPTITYITGQEVLL